jgi:hypothetical protein
MQFREIFQNDELHYSLGTNTENGESIIRVTVTSVGWRDFYFKLTADEFASFAIDPRSLDDLADRFAHDQGKRYYADRLVE